jgi:p-aminobenzoyl-glutamate transporter AbgT
MYLTDTRNIDPSVYDTPYKLSWQIFFSVSSAIFGCLNQLLVAIANKYENANKLAIASTTNLLFSYFLEYILRIIDQNYANNMNIYRTGGALLIFLAAISSIIAKIVHQKLEKKVDLTEEEDQKDLDWRLS